MIDIIIPVYNARETLPLTLMSINLQEVSCKYKVTIIDDCSTENYDDILDYYKKYLDINYKKLNKNGGGGIARQVGLDITSNPYIVFIDADDFFYDTDSLQNLYFNIEKGYDVVSAGEYDELKNINMVNDGDLHGKIYRRKYIVDNNIKFNETRFHEDNYFNSMVLLTGAKNYNFYYLVYIYSNNDKSITKIDKSKEFERLEILLSNIKEIFGKININDNNIEQVKHFVFIKYKYYNRIYKDFTDEQKDIFMGWVKKYDPNNIDLIGIEEPEEIEKMVDVKYCK